MFFQSRLGTNLYITAIGTGVVDLARCQVGRPVDHNAVVEIMACCLCFVAAAGTDMGVFVVLSPVTPAMYVLQFIYRLSLGMTAIGAGVGLNALFLLGGLCRDYTLVPAVCSSACAATNRTGLLVIGIAVRCPVAPTVGFALRGNTAVSITCMGVRVGGCICTVVFPVAPIVAQCFDGFGLGCATVKTGKCLNAILGASGSRGFFAVIPTVSNGFSLAAFGIGASASVGIAVCVVYPITKIADVRRLTVNSFGSIQVCRQHSRTVLHDIAVFPHILGQTHHRHLAIAILNELQSAAVREIRPGTHKINGAIAGKVNLPVLVIHDAGILIVAVPSLLHHQVAFTVIAEHTAVCNPIVGNPHSAHTVGFLDSVPLLVVLKHFLVKRLAAPDTGFHQLELHGTFVDNGNGSVSGDRHFNEVGCCIDFLVLCTGQSVIDPEIVIVCADFLIGILVFHVIQHAVFVQIYGFNAIGDAVFIFVNDKKVKLVVIISI